MRSKLRAMLWRHSAARRHGRIELGQTIEIPREIGRSSTKVSRWVVCRLVDFRHNPHVEIEQRGGDVKKVVSEQSIWSTYRARVVPGL